ncbi:MAG: ORF6N domain-containing protein [Bacilli bacterium]|nr:ORF6N domain-containing protein [Bacilli bacterium]
MNEAILVDNLKIEDMIYEGRGKQVMLDSDLAKLYHVETKRINENVKNNMTKFPERFSWILTDEESKNLLVDIFDQKKETRGDRFKNPRVFTEQGVYMLATILKSKEAVDITLKIMDTFVYMKHFISIGLLEQRFYNDMTIRHESEIKILQESFNKLYENIEEKEVYFDGKIYDAYSKIIDIFSEAKDELIIIDRYTDKTILDMIKNLNCKVFIITGKNTKLTKTDIEKYNATYDNLTIIYNDEYHDRYFIIDKNKIYHSGNSVNHIGYRKSSIDLLADMKVKKAIIKDIEKIISSY